MRDESTNEILKQFILSLPDTIRDLVALPPMMGMVAGENFRERTPTEAFCDVMDFPGTGILQIAAICGLIEFALGDGSDTIDHSRMEELAEELNNATMKRTALEGPLRDKHYAQARERWMILRSGLLSVSSLRERQWKSLAKHRP